MVRYTVDNKNKTSVSDKADSRHWTQFAFQERGFLNGSYILLFPVWYKQGQVLPGPRLDF
jgi:hypothetical protein